MHGVIYIQMRISGGTAKGRVTAKKHLFSKGLNSPGLRPTSSKVREALFDILRGRLDGSVFADIYAGTGTVGLEALSRGAGTVLFVEWRQFLINIIRDSAEKLGCDERIMLIKEPAEEFFGKSLRRKQKIDIFFIDPPYHSDEIDKVLPVVAQGHMLKKEGIVVVEHFFKKKLPGKVVNLEVQKHYRYGDTGLTLYTKAEI